METQANILIVIGSAPGVQEDIASVPGPCPRDYMAIGMDAVSLSSAPLRWLATFHPAEIPEIMKRRTALIGHVDFTIISHERREHVAHCIDDWWKPSGSSALLGVQAALTVLGYRRIILCGVPLTGKNFAGGDYENFRKGWEPRLKELGGRVRSMSGWTADFLGRPDAGWLGGGGEK